MEKQNAIFLLAFIEPQQAWNCTVSARRTGPHCTLCMPPLPFSLIEANPCQLLALNMHCVPLFFLSRLPKMSCRVAGSRAAAGAFHFLLHSYLQGDPCGKSLQGVENAHAVTQLPSIQPPCKLLLKIWGEKRRGQQRMLHASIWQELASRRGRERAAVEEELE